MTRKKSSRVLEIAVDDIAGVDIAHSAGIRRVELCSALALGGLTPHLSLLEYAVLSDCEVAAMIRPRAGGFVYTVREIDQMKREIEIVCEAGARAVVFGALDNAHNLDKSSLKALIAAAGDMDTVLHRAFDLCPDPVRALEDAIELNFNRILTSGHAENVELGFARILELSKIAGGRIDIMPGGGLKPEHIQRFLNDSDMRDFHCSASRILVENDRQSMIGIAPERKITDLAQIKLYQNKIEGSVA